jgi:predicted nucleic acid-binding protein
LAAASDEAAGQLSVFVDSSVWFAAVSARDRDNERAKAILAGTSDHVTTDHVLVETWLLLNSRFRKEVAERFWEGLRRGGIRIEPVTTADLEAAWAIGQAFPDQNFSIVDRTSFAVMERLNIVQAASFDDDFAIYRHGRARDQAFELVRSGHSENFRLLHRAILERKQVTCVYKGHSRELCPHVLGHKNEEEAALVFQFGGKSAGRLPREGQWRCLYLADVTELALRSGPWHSGSQHRKRQHCVDRVYVDVNTNVPNQPGRR